MSIPNKVHKQGHGRRKTKSFNQVVRNKNLGQKSNKITTVLGWVGACLRKLDWSDRER